MRQTLFRANVLSVTGMAVVLAACWLCLGTTAPAQATSVRHSTAGDLFYNYNVPPAGYGSVGAKMYPCPRPTPPLVGHTYVTYQPLMPQEFLYHHHRVYKTKHDDAPKTRTSVRWR